MADPSFTLQNDGLAIRSDNGAVLSEWWTNLSTGNVGGAYQARATITNERLDGAIPSGVFGAWVTLGSGQTWLLDSGGAGKGGLEFTLEVRGATTLDLQASANIILGDLVGPVDGDFYWNLSDSSGNPIETISNSPLLAFSAFFVTYSQQSLRSDGAGTSILVNGGPNSGLTNVNNFSPPYSGGFTIEMIIQPHVKNDSGLPSRRTAGTLATRGNNMRWTFQWDNYDDVSEPNTDLLPVFVIKPSAGNYWDESDIPPDPVDAYIRGNIPVIINNTYHVMITFRPSTNDCQLWINGESIGVSDLGGFLTGSILSGAHRTEIELKGALAAGARQAPNVTFDDIKVHLLEADQAFATKQSGTANFT